MSEPITYVGIDAHKAELQVAVLAPDRMVDRLRRRLEKVAPGPVACCYESWAVRVCVAATARAGPGPLRRDRAGAGAAQTG